MRKEKMALTRFIENLPVEAVIEETQVTTLSLIAGEVGETNKTCINDLDCTGSHNIGCTNTPSHCNYSQNESCNQVIVKPTNLGCHRNENCLGCTVIGN